MRTSNQTSYVIDTSVLINFGIFTPHNVHRTFWSRMEEAIDDGKIIIINEVADECTIDPIKQWIDVQRDAGRVIKVNQQIYDRAEKINKKYHIVTEERNRKTGRAVTKSNADPVIIAYAENNKCTVFTRESDRAIKGGKQFSFSKENPGNIPVVCKRLGVPYARFPDEVLHKVIQPI